MSSLKKAFQQAAAELAPLFGNTMTFSVALQIVQPLQRESLNTLLVLSLSVGMAIVVLAACRVYLTDRGWHAITPDMSELKQTAAPLVLMLIYLLQTSERVMVQFESVLIGSVLVQEAKQIHSLETSWAITYASFGVALGWAMVQSLGR
jgi:hypothetical protein